MEIKRYLLADVDLARGSVDDSGDTGYAELSQNVPDGFVTDLQTDLNALEFSEAGTPDGAFGQKTRNAVVALQGLSGIAPTGAVDSKTRAAMRFWLENGHTKSRPPSEAAPTPRTLQGLTYVAPRVRHFSQGDERWAANVLGRNQTIRRSGCAITCIAMILRHSGRDVDPGTMDAFLDANEGYVDDSVKWNVAGECGAGSDDGLVYGRMTGTTDQLRSAIHDRLSENRPTMVRVDYGSDTNLKYNHFVLAVGRTVNGNIIMNDPATRHGDGYLTPEPDHLIETTGRKQGYDIVHLDWYD